MSGLQNVNPMLPSRRVALQGTHQRPILAEYNELSSDDDSRKFVVHVLCIQVYTHDVPVCITHDHSAWGKLW